MKNDNFHVYPLNDLFAHTTDRLQCKCNPELKWQGDYFLVVHKAYDNRKSQNDVRVPQ
jgi:hypothetical protein